MSLQRSVDGHFRDDFMLKMMELKDMYELNSKLQEHREVQLERELQELKKGFADLRDKFIISQSQLQREKAGKYDLLQNKQDLEHRIYLLEDQNRQLNLEINEVYELLSSERPKAFIEDEESEVNYAQPEDEDYYSSAPVRRTRSLIESVTVMSPILEENSEESSDADDCSSMAVAVSYSDPTTSAEKAKEKDLKSLSIANPKPALILSSALNEDFAQTPSNSENFVTSLKTSTLPKPRKPKKKKRYKLMLCFGRL